MRTNVFMMFLLFPLLGFGYTMQQGIAPTHIKAMFLFIDGICILGVAYFAFFCNLKKMK